MATPQQYVINKLTPQDKVWPELLDKAIEKHLQTTVCSKELTTFYTDVKNVIRQHLAVNLLQIIKDIRQAITSYKASITAQNNISKPVSTNIIVRLAVNKVEKLSLLAQIIDVLKLSEYTNLLSDLVEKMLVCEQDANFSTLLEEFDAAGFIATFVAGYLVTKLQDNLSPIGIEKYGKLYTNAVVRVIVEKQLGAKGPLADYKNLIKYLAKIQLGKNKFLPSIIEALIKSAQIGNPYVRAVGIPNELLFKKFKQSNAFTNQGLICAAFLAHADFLQYLDSKSLVNSSVFACFAFRQQGSLTQYLQLEPQQNSMPIAEFFDKIIANYNNSMAPVNDDLKSSFTGDMVATRYGAVDQYYKQNNVDIAIGNENYLHSSHSINQSATPDLTRQDVRAIVVAQKTAPAPFDRSHGAYPKGAQIIARGPRSYKQSRDTQLLRHIATQLYGFCRINKVDPVEVQLMYYDKSLYVSTNRLDAARLIAGRLNNTQALKEALVSPYYCGSSSKIKISRRHANKIRTRVYGEFDFSNANAEVIKRLLNNSLLRISPLDISTLNGTKDSFKHEPNRLYVVIQRAQSNGRHAEEDLMDLIETIYHQNNEKLSGKAIIYGKRRPCFSCYSRLDSLQVRDDASIKFNTRPGLFFAAAFFGQSAVAATETFSRLSTVAKIYESSDDVGYNTLSDSENEYYRTSREQFEPSIYTKQSKMTWYVNHKEFYNFIAKKCANAAHETGQIANRLAKPLFYMSGNAARVQKGFWELTVGGRKEGFINGLKQLSLQRCSLDNTMRIR